MSSQQWGRIVLVCTAIFGAGIAPHSSAIGAENTSDAVKMPANHRALIAKYILTQERIEQATLNTAMISKPFAKWGGLLRGGTIPAACVSIETSNMLGMEFTGYLLFTVENGQAIRLANGMDTCPPFSPFTEVRKKTAGRSAVGK